MIVKYKILTGVEGTTGVGSGSFIFSKILKVKREGLGFKESNIVLGWGGRDYMFDPSHGIIRFNPAEPFSAGNESVYVLYKT